METIRENASQLAKRIVRVVEEPEPIYKKSYQVKYARTGKTYILVLSANNINNDSDKVLNLSDRDAAKILQK